MRFSVLLGALIGYSIARWDGLLIGVLAGYYLPPVLGRFAINTAKSKLQQLQGQFVESTFAVMGAVCKADGRVSAEEIRMAEQLFAQLHLSAEARDTARRAFNRGKSPGFDLDAELARFVQATRGQRVLHQIFLQVQLSALAADGALHPAEREMLLRIGRGLGLSAAEISQLEAMLRSGGGGGASAGGHSSRAALDDAYAVLGVAANASDTEVKRAYRRLMSENHPDKLAAKGLPESMRELAERKTRDITSAYRRITEARAQAT